MAAGFGQTSLVLVRFGLNSCLFLAFCQSLINLGFIVPGKVSLSLSGSKCLSSNYALLSLVWVLDLGKLISGFKLVKTRDIAIYCSNLLHKRT